MASTITDPCANSDPGVTETAGMVPLLEQCPKENRLLGALRPEYALFNRLLRETARGKIAA